MVALHFLKQLVAMDHKAMNAFWQMGKWGVERAAVCVCVIIIFLTHCNLGGWWNWEVHALHLQDLCLG